MGLFNTLKPFWDSMFEGLASDNPLWSNLLSSFKPGTISLLNKPEYVETKVKRSTELFDPNAGKAEAYMKFMLEGNFRNGRKATLKFNEYWDADVDDRKTAWESTQRTNLLMADSERRKQEFMADSADWDKYNLEQDALDYAKAGWVYNPLTNSYNPGNKWDKIALEKMGLGNSQLSVQAWLAAANKANAGKAGWINLVEDGKFGKNTEAAYNNWLKNNSNWDGYVPTTPVKSQLPLTKTTVTKPQLVDSTTVNPEFKNGNWYKGDLLLNLGQMYLDSSGNYYQYNSDGTKTSVDPQMYNLYDEIGTLGLIGHDPNRAYITQNAVIRDLLDNYVQEYNKRHVGANVTKYDIVHTPEYLRYKNKIFNNLSGSFFSGYKI